MNFPDHFVDLFLFLLTNKNYAKMTNSKSTRSTRRTRNSEEKFITADESFTEKDSKAMIKPETTEETTEKPVDSVINLMSSSVAEDDKVHEKDADKVPEDENAKVSSHEEVEKDIDPAEDPVVADVVATLRGERKSLDKSFMEGLSKAKITTTKEDEEKMDDAGPLEIDEKELLPEKFEESEEEEIEMRVDTVNEEAHFDKDHAHSDKDRAHIDKDDDIAHTDVITTKLVLPSTPAVAPEKVGDDWAAEEIDRVDKEWTGTEKSSIANDMSHAKLTPPMVHAETPRSPLTKSFKKPETPRRDRKDLKPSILLKDRISPKAGEDDEKEKGSKEILHRVGYMVFVRTEVSSRQIVTLSKLLFFS